MEIYHTSPDKILEINNNGMFGDVLFFSDNVYFMTQSNDPVVYKMEVSEDSIIDVRNLDSESVIVRIAEYLNINEDDAERVLDGRDTAWDYNGDGEADWYMLQLQAECAKEMGYKACRSQDEQGVVYMICMTDMLDELIEVPQ